jgi:hypothetical protein
MQRRARQLADTGQGEPPELLDGFPVASQITQLHRLSDFPGVWWYASINTVDEPTGGRFDLVAPEGTCPLAEDLEGAVIEKLLRGPVKVVVAERLAELFHATVTVRSTPPVADLTAPSATGFGVNAELHSMLDYTVPRRWAARLRRDGFRGLRHLLRGDNTGRTAGRALFGRAGLHRRAPAGMSTNVGGRGVEIRPIPSSVPIADPPA